MNLIAVFDALEARLKTITGLRVYPWATAQITPPGSVLTMPDRIVVRGAGRGLDRIEGLTVITAVGRASDRGAVRTLSPYVSSSGAKSIGAALESGTYTDIDVVEVKEITFDFIEWAGKPFLAAAHELTITGPGGTP